MLAGAGAGNTTENGTYYLHSGLDYWAGAPSDFLVRNSFVFFVDSTGILDSNGVNNSLGVRPSISLKSGTVISSGDGSYGNPYVVLS